MSDEVEMKDNFCDSQPVIQSSVIQDFGLLFVLDLKFKILQVSVNAESSLGIPCAEILGRKMTDFLDPEISHVLDNGLKSGDMRCLNGMGLKLKTHSGPKAFSASFSFYEKYLVLELEFFDDKIQTASELIARNGIFRLSLELKQSATLQEMCAKTASELKAILGMDKVMIYSFDESWHGTVLAEAKESGMDSYIGLKFPATDIPEPARRLYHLNPVRMIPGVGNPAIRVEPALNPLTGTPSDFKKCILRGVNPVHLEYLQNMSVISSISVAIIHKGALWGLIAFHHRSYRTLSIIVRNALEMLSECFSSQLFLLEAAESNLEMAEIENYRKLTAEAVILQETPSSVLSLEIEKISGLMNAQGAAFYLDGQWFEWGTVPVRAELELLVKWLQSKSAGSVYTTHSLARDYAGGEKIKDTASGLLAVSISGTFEELVLWFRPEEAQIVKWGGDPNQTIHFSLDKKFYHPRQSFQIWKETVKLQSSVWKTSEKIAADQMRMILTNALLGFRSARLKTISGLLPICAYCKKIRDDQNSWRVIEEYVQKRSTASFSHGICPDCYKRVMKESGLNGGS